MCTHDGMLSPLPSAEPEHSGGLGGEGGNGRNGLADFGDEGGASDGTGVGNGDGSGFSKGVADHGGRSGLSEEEVMAMVVICEAAAMMVELWR